MVGYTRLLKHWWLYPWCDVSFLLAFVQSGEAVIPLEGSDIGATDELQSWVSKLEDKVKDLEQKVANLFMDNVALKTKLEASREVERQQQEEIIRLNERLVQALRAQVNMHFWSMHALLRSLLSPFPCVQQDTATQELLLSKTKESQLEDKIKVLEETRSNLEAEAEKREKQLKQLEICLSDTEQHSKVHIPIAYSSCMCMCACVRACACVCMCVHVCVYVCACVTNL